MTRFDAYASFDSAAQHRLLFARWQLERGLLTEEARCESLWCPVCGASFAETLSLLSHPCPSGAWPDDS